MKDSPVKLLLIESSCGRNVFLSQMLNENGYQTETLEKIELVIEKIINHTIDLVICENKVNKYTGFEVFKLLKQYIRNSGIPFFLVFDTFEKEDMLIGLEMGIDNFIVTPINKFSVFYKIENQLRKKEEIDIYESNVFKGYYQSSSVAMLFVSNNKIESVNQAFCKLFSASTHKIEGMAIESVFKITENNQNEMNYRRFQNGIANECKLVNVSCGINSSFTFVINFYRRNNFGTNAVFAEVMPTLFVKIVENRERILRQKPININAISSNLTVNTVPINIKLTERENMVFKLSALGLPIKIIASKLNLSERTVEKHRANIMAKTNAKNMIEAIVCIQKPAESSRGLESLCN